MRRVFQLTLIVALALFCSACFTVEVERQIAAAQTKQIRQNFFLFGRIGEPEIDLAKECPTGVASFGDTFTWSDVLLGVFTLGIYTPRTVVLKCAV